MRDGVIRGSFPYFPMESLMGCGYGEPVEEASGIRRAETQREERRHGRSPGFR